MYLIRPIRGLKFLAVFAFSGLLAFNNKRPHSRLGRLAPLEIYLANMPPTKLR